MHANVGAVISRNEFINIYMCVYVAEQKDGEEKTSIISN